MSAIANFFYKQVLNDVFEVFEEENRRREVMLHKQLVSEQAIEISS